jgi:CRISPR/Cas system CSM-associated protein Csm3 (group 7 of RAMP superfamily)
VPGTPITLDYQIRTLSPLGLAVPEGTAGDPVTVPGSTLKGAARRSGAAVLALLGLPACRQDADPECPLCRLFGAPGLDAALHWAAATRNAEIATKPGPTALPRRNAVDRSTGTSAREPVPAGLAVPGGMLLYAHVRGWLAQAASRDAGLLVAALERLEYLGGGRATGAGRVSVKVGTVRLGDEEVASAELLSSLLTQEAV